MSEVKNSRTERRRETEILYSCGKGSNWKRVCSEGCASWKCAGSTVEPTVVVRYCMRKPLAMVSLIEFSYTVGTRERETSEGAW